MKLISCYIANFGKLSNFRYNFSDGVDVILEENGWGKTTLTVFIKAMLYGLPKTSKRDVAENERKKYTPWQGGPYGGELVFSVGDKPYRIERYFGEMESDDTFELYDNRTNMPSDDYTLVGEQLFGLNASAYERSTFFSGRDVDGATNSMSAKLNGLIEDEEDIGAFDHAIARIDEARKKYKLDRGNGGLLENLDLEGKDLNRRLEEAKRAERSLLDSKERGKIELAELEEAEKEEKLAEESFVRANEEKARLEIQARYRAMNEKRKRDEEKLEELYDFFKGEIPAISTLDEIDALYAEKQKLEGERNALPLNDYAIQEIEEVDMLELQKHTERADRIIKELEKMRIVNDTAYFSFAEELPRLQAEKFIAPPKEIAEENVKRAQQEFSDAVENAKRFHERTKPEQKGKTALIVTMIVSLLTVVGIVVFIPCLIAFLVGKNKTKIELAEYEKDRQESDDRLARATSDLESTQEMLRQAERRDYVEDRIRVLSEEIKTYEHAQDLYSKLAYEESFLTVLGIRRENEMWTVRYYHYSQALKQYKQYQKLLAKSEELTAELLKIQKKITDFEERYEANVTTVRGQLKSLNFYEEEVERQKMAISAFEEEKNVTSAILEEELADRTEESYVARRNATRRREFAEEKVRARRQAEEKLSLTVDSIPDLETSLQANKEAYLEANEKHDTLVETKKYLKKAREELSARYMGKMQESLSRFLTAFGCDKLGSFGFDTELELVFRTVGGKKDLAFLSKGYREVLELCSRFALVDSLFPDEKPFLILDDPFADLDGDNLEIALNVLKQASSHYQILYFICHDSRKL